MNPAIVIPSYWAQSDRLTDIGEVGVYDHVTAVDKPMPELETCLSSLERVRGVLRVIILLVSPLACEESARARVNGICRTHPNLNPLVVGRAEASVLMRVVEDQAPSIPGEPVALRGYGAIRNMGLAVSAALGHDVVVFLDDDEVVLDEDFLIKAVYGLGMKNRQGIPILAKTGYFLDRNDSPYASGDRPLWSERYWSKGEEFNAAMRQRLSGTRISRSTTVCGGCFALTAQVFCKVAFDPVITRGEDLDYLINLRMHGFDMWFDNEWCVKHLPPDIPSHASRFQQDVYRWMYERRKLQVANDTIGLRRVTPDSLVPYPEPWLSDAVETRIAKTALRRAIVGPERLDYLMIYLFGRARARRWAMGVSDSYLSLETYWPCVMDGLWDNRLLARKLVSMGSAHLVGHRPGGERDQG